MTTVERLQDRAEQPQGYMRMCRYFLTAETNEDLDLISAPYLATEAISNHDVALALAAVRTDKGWLHDTQWSA